MVSPVGRHLYMNAAVNSITTPTGSQTQASSQKKRKSSVSNKPKSKERQFSPRGAQGSVGLALDHIVNSGILNQMQNFQITPTAQTKQARNLKMRARG